MFANYSAAEDIMKEYAAYLGIDWADTKHDLCLMDTASGTKTRLVIQHTPEAIAEYFTGLRARYAGQQIAVGLEQSRGPLLFALLQYDFLVCFPSTPPPWRSIARRFHRHGPRMIRPTPPM